MTESELRGQLADNVATIERRIAAACVRAGRVRADVTLVAVTKYVSPTIARLLHELGIADLGESRPQELWRKAATLPASVRWHMIGHLQRNKVDRTVPLVHTIHSVDSVRLIDALGQEAARQARQCDILIEINLTGEANKTGMPPESLVNALAAVKQHASLRCHGLMTLAAHDEPESCRPVFAQLRELVVANQLQELSMGMSNDFEVAIEEGATMIRLGSVLFEGIRAAT